MKKKLLVPSVILVFFLISFSFLLLLFLIFSRSSSKSNNKSLGDSYLYQEINPQSQETTYGFVTLKQQISEDSFLSYRNEESGKIILISNIFNQEYTCHGTCSCSHTTHRKTASIGHSLTRPLFIILSALSTSMAIKMAQKSFDHHCSFENFDEDDCDETESEIEDCIIEAPRIEEIEDRSEEELTEFGCYGNCVDNEKVNTYSGMEKQEEMDCLSQKIDGIVKVYKKDYLPLDYEKDSLFLAKKKFYKEYLDPYCYRISEMEYEDWDHGMYSITMVTGHVCAALDFKGLHDNIKCKINSVRTATKNEEEYM